MLLSIYSGFIGALYMDVCNDREPQVVADTILGSTGRRLSKQGRQLLILLLSREPIKLGDALAELESRQVGDLGRHLAAIADAATETAARRISEFRSLLSLSCGDQLLAAVEMRNILERWALTNRSDHVDGADALSDTRENLREYFLPQQWTNTSGPTSGEMFEFARTVHGREDPRDTRGFLAIVAWLLWAARAKDGEAQAALGYYFAECGDVRRYLYWTRRAARRDCTIAFFNLGLSYARGSDGVRQNHKKALRYLLDAVKGGCSHARAVVGRIYVELADYRRAKFWLQRAVRLTQDEYALCSLGFMYERGLGVTPSIAVALEYYVQAANRGIGFASKAARRLGASIEAL
jgi:TPR repeat protein